jgi:ABC-type uncharacterized transport system substrate-binding protein
MASKRRWAFAVGALLLFTPRVDGQTRPKRIGYIGPTTSSSPTAVALREGLIELGYVEGRDFVIEARFAEGKRDRFPAIANEIVSHKVDVIALVGAITARAAMKATTTIPIVFAVVLDPVHDSLVTNMQIPGGNVTGVTTYDPQQPTKQLALLKTVIPGLRRVAILGDASVSEALLNANDKAAHALGVDVTRLRVAAPNPDIEGALAKARNDSAGALLVLEEPAVVAARQRIVELAGRDRLPTMFAPDWADAGGLLAYGTSLVEGARRMVTYVDKILKGAKPGDLPVEAVTRYQLVVNLKTARQLGVTIPPDVLKQANRIIE